MGSTGSTLPFPLNPLLRGKRERGQIRFEDALEPNQHVTMTSLDL
jgi:hypothetical protein